MPNTNFNPLRLTSAGLEVGGPLHFYNTDERDQIMGEITVRYLLVQEAEVAQNPPWLLEGVAGRDGTDSWGTVVERTRLPAGLRPGLDPEKTRGIAVAVLLKKPEPGVEAPPYFETVTWCVNLEVHDDT
jgi:hypothetical protein